MSASEVYDYVIVGAGSAGCVLAGALTARADLSVCLVEAGDARRRMALEAPMMLQQALRAKAVNWGYWTAPQPALNDRRLSWPRGKTLGGSSAINAMHYIRGAAENYDEWARELGADGWAWSDVRDAFKQVQHQTRGADAFHGAGGPLWVQDIRPLNPLTERYLEAGQALQLPLNPDFNGARQDGVGTYQVTQKGARRCSAADAFLRPALNRPNLTVVTKALARRIAIEGGRAAGVEVETGGARRLLAARREVICAAGAVNGPQLLMLSGIGPADHLRAHGLSVEVDAPGVGANLQDHLDVTARITTRTAASIGYSLRSAPGWAWAGLRWLMTRTGALGVNPVQGGGFARSRFARDLPDLQLTFIPAPAPPHGREYVLGHGATLHATGLYPKSRGTIRLASTDPAEPPLIDPCYGSETEDLEVLADGLDLARRILSASAFDDERVAEVEPGPEITTRDALLADIRARAETLYHPTSTCAMGAGALGVLDPVLKVRGVAGLRVADASAMPRLVGGNTNAPAIMIATRAAAMILADAD